MVSLMISLGIVVLFLTLLFLLERALGRWSADSAPPDLGRSVDERWW